MFHTSSSRQKKSKKSKGIPSALSFSTKTSTSRTSASRFAKKQTSCNLPSDNYYSSMIDSMLSNSVKLAKTWQVDIGGTLEERYRRKVVLLNLVLLAEAYCFKVNLDRYTKTHNHSPSGDCMISIQQESRLKPSTVTTIAETGKFIFGKSKDDFPVLDSNCNNVSLHSVIAHTHEGGTCTCNVQPVDPNGMKFDGKYDSKKEWCTTYSADALRWYDRVGVVGFTFGLHVPAVSGDSQVGSSSNKSYKIETFNYVMLGETTFTSIGNIGPENLSGGGFDFLTQTSTAAQGKTLSIAAWAFFKQLKALGYSNPGKPNGKFPEISKYMLKHHSKDVKNTQGLKQRAFLALWAIHPENIHVPLIALFYEKLRRGADILLPQRAKSIMSYLIKTEDIGEKNSPPLTDLLHSMSFQTQQHWKKQPDSSTTNIEPYISQPLSASPFRKKKRKRITVQSSAICCDVCSRTHTLPSICSKVIEYQGNFPCGSGCTVNFTGKYLYEILDNISRPEEDDVAASSFVVPQMPYLNSYDERKKQFMYIMNTFI